MGWMNKYSKKNSGFTLVEMLIVIAIIGILAALTVPSLIDKAKRANEVADMTNAKALQEVFSIYADAHPVDPDNPDDPASIKFDSDTQEIISTDDEVKSAIIKGLDGRSIPAPKDTIFTIWALSKFAPYGVDLVRMDPEDSEKVICKTGESKNLSDVILLAGEPSDIPAPDEEPPGGSPDLEFEHLWIDSVEAGQNSKIIIRAMVKNISADNSLGGFKIYCQMVPGAITFPEPPSLTGYYGNGTNIDGGQSKKTLVTKNYTEADGWNTFIKLPQPGTYRLRFYIGNTNSASDSDTTNNYANVTFTLNGTLSLDYHDVDTDINSIVVTPTPTPTPTSTPTPRPTPTLSPTPIPDNFTGMIDEVNAVGVTLDLAGGDVVYMYVSDWNNNRVQKYKPDGGDEDLDGVDDDGNDEGDLDMTIGGQTPGGGDGDGEFTQCSATAVDSLHNLYVVDSNNHRIQKFDSDGEFVGKWGTPGSGNGEFSGPRGIAIDSQGNIYVSDMGNNRVQKFKEDTNSINFKMDYVDKWGSDGVNPGQFNAPMGIAVDKNDYIYVADSGNCRIQKFDSTGKCEGMLGSNGTGNFQFNCPVGISLDSNDNIYVADSVLNRVQKFKSDMITFLGKYGRNDMAAGSEPLEFSSPYAVAVHPNGNIFVAERDNNRIQRIVP